MTARKADAGAQIRELVAEEVQAVAGGADLSHVDLSRYVMVNRYVSPLDIHAFNPQPDPPARVLAAAVG